MITADHHFRYASTQAINWDREAVTHRRPITELTAAVPTPTPNSPGYRGARVSAPVRNSIGSDIRKHF
jgi:hypothetical protein